MRTIWLVKKLIEMLIRFKLKPNLANLIIHDFFHKVKSAINRISRESIPEYQSIYRRKLFSGTVEEKVITLKKIHSLLEKREISKFLFMSG